MADGPWEKAGGGGGDPGERWWPGTGDPPPRGQDEAECTSTVLPLLVPIPPIPVPLAAGPPLFPLFHQATYPRPRTPGRSPSLPCQPQINAPSPAVQGTRSSPGPAPAPRPGHKIPAGGQR